MNVSTARPLCPLLLVLLPLAALAQQSAIPNTQLTIYNDDFAVVRTSIDLTLTPGLSDITTTSVTRQLEPDSVVLRDPTGRTPIRIAEQNYDAAVVNQDWLLSKFEGKTLDFRTPDQHIVQARIIRAPRLTFDPNFGQQQQQPLIEIDGHLQFSLPGEPLFPASTDGLLLKPTLHWRIDSPRAAHLPAELAYITRALRWEATYNIVAADASPSGPASEEPASLTGWVTIRNDSGTDFPDAAIKLMAGDVAKLQESPINGRVMYAMAAQTVSVDGAAVTQKAFDDLHLYDLHRAVTLLNGETKQVQFLEVPRVTLHRSYAFDGTADIPFQAALNGSYFLDQNWRNGSNTKVNIREEIANTEANHLGLPLPAGRIRLYRQDTASDPHNQASAGAIEFIGEAAIPHTPADQPVKINLGNAFDLTGARKQTDFHVDTRARTIDETFEIKLTNAKPQPATIHVTEHLGRSLNWEITAKSAPFTRTDSSTVDFPITVPPHANSTFTYTAHYTW